MSSTSKESGKRMELATFYIGEALCGLDILNIQEINKIQNLTPVPQAPEYVRGVLNLRGRIVSIIDLAKKVGLGDTSESLDTRNLIVTSRDGTTGLFVTKIGDVCEIEMDAIESTPVNMHGIQETFFSGVYKSKTELIGILDLDQVLNT